ncbi:MAG: BrnT family toxin [Gammaproteobacteria bacterium]
MRCEWDHSKNQANLLKHGLGFEDAALVLSGQIVSFEDDRADYGELRLISLGTLGGRVVVVVHTPRADVTRIISMRKANEREQKIYQERLGKA